MTTAIPFPAVAAPIFATPRTLAPIVSPLAPVIAGARARGVADAFDWLGIAAVLFDEQGDLLHANDGAKRRLGTTLRLELGRLVAAEPEADRALQAAIREAIGGGRTRLAIPAHDTGGAIALRIESMDGSSDDPFQLLKAVAVFENDGTLGFESPAQPN